MSNNTEIREYIETKDRHYSLFYKISEVMQFVMIYAIFSIIIYTLLIPTLFVKLWQYFKK